MLRNIISIIVLTSAIGLTANALTVDLTEAGTLSDVVSEPLTVTDLTLSGPVNAADLFFVSTEMENLKSLNLSGIEIEAYSGRRINGLAIYPAATIPANVFVASKITSLTLPSSAVTIGDGAFAGAEITTLTIPDNIVSLSDGAFAGCPNLSSLTISCHNVGTGAFAGCPSLKTVTINKPVELGERAFSGCTALSTITGSENITIIGERAFAEDSSLSAFSFGSSLTAIGAEAFVSTAITSINLTGCSSLTAVGDWAFSKMPVLETLDLGNVSEIGEGIVFDCPELVNLRTSTNITEVPAYAYVGDSKMDTTYMLPADAVSIGDYALANLPQVTTLILPATLESIGSYAMMNMTGLQALTVQSPTMASLGENVWEGVDQPSAILYVPVGQKEAYSDAAQWQEFNIVEGTTGVEDIVNAEVLAGLKGRFVGHELQVSVNGVDIETLALYDPAGVLLTAVDPMSELVCIDTEGMSARIYIVTATLADGRKATLKLAK